MTDDPRRKLGARGEELAAQRLEQRGYRIVDRNFRTRSGELDLVAQSPEYLVFCEVKTRIVRRSAGPFGPLAAVGARKQAQVRRMAREWLAARRGLAGCAPELRFDAIGIAVDPRGTLVSIEHLEGAF